MNAKEISSKVVADLRSCGAIMNKLFWHTTTFDSGLVFVMPGTTDLDVQDAVIAKMESKGYVFEEARVGWTVTHKKF